MTSEFPLIPISNPIFDALEVGQSIWYDNVRRSLLTSGQLTRMVSEDGLRGVTSNPTIFDKAIEGSSDYKEALLSLRGSVDAKAAYEQLAFADISTAADILHSVYDASSGQDGFVSIEVPPYLSHDTSGTVEEAQRIWTTIGRPNLMVKVPATPEGIAALRTLIALGINVNVTLIFSVAVYEDVAKAYIDGINDRYEAGEDISKIASVASFFISRIDSAIDPVVSAELRGKVGIASAKTAYGRFGKIFSSPEWKFLEAKGAAPQRLLWASTGVKTPAYPELMYVESLIGPHTVNTVPPATYESFKTRGKVRETLTENLDEAERQLIRLSEEGISLQAVTSELLEEGLGSFQDSFTKLLRSIEVSIQADVTAGYEMDEKLPDEIAVQVAETENVWRESSRIERIWLHDRKVWSSTDEDKWLGWLSTPMDQRNHGHRFREIAKFAGGHRFRDAVVLGMGGSSLCPEALSLTFNPVDGFPRLSILDSTDPLQIKQLEQRLDLSKTLFFVSSKSGTTLEPNIYADYFYDRTRSVVGEEEVGKRFIAITDPGSPLEERALREKWSGIYHGVPSIGGRYSALSDFGMIPGAASGFNVLELLERAETMAHACAACVPLSHNPGFRLGAIMGVCANRGIDKLTIVTSKSIFDLSAWLSQLLAESTGKDGKGIIPVDGEPLGEPSSYGSDRLFVYIKLDSDEDDENQRKIDAIKKAGFPVCEITLGDPYDIGREFYRWEFATAVAGSIIDIDPFNQPDVEDAKIITRELTEKYESQGSLPKLEPVVQDDHFAIFTDESNANQLRSDNPLLTVENALTQHFNRVVPGDYVAFLAYVPMTGENEEAMVKLRSLARDRLKVATCVGFGPRFQHSTGQAYKGGPNTGVFLQITCDDITDIKVPGHNYTFGFVKEAQARGDLNVLTQRERRAVRIHIFSDLSAGLNRLAGILERSISQR